MQYLILFFEGIVTFISPCVLPLLPLYISYFAAGESDLRRTLTNACGFVLGFIVVFVALGTFAGTVGYVLREYSTVLNIITGVIVIIFGLNYLGVGKLSFLDRLRPQQANVRDLNAVSAFVFGVVFSIGWTPCVSAFLGSALLLAAQSTSTLQGSLMLFVYSLGLGIPFILSALLIDRLKGAFDAIKRSYKTINTISGILLIIMGVLMMTGLMSRLLSALA